MSYERLTDKDQPELDTAASLWRYMDLPKLASLLSSGGLHFSQLPLLGDPFEGSLVKAVRDNIERVKPIIARDYPEFVRTDEQMRNSIMTSRAYSYACCWHHNEYESAAMWHQYARDGFGVGVRSTIGRMIDAVARVEEPVWIGQVNYHDYETAQPSQNSLWTPMFQKRKSFMHEQEVRALVMDRDRMDSLRGAWEYKENPTAGRLVEADLGILIERIYLAPNSPPWYTETIRRVVDALGFDHIEIVQSDMAGSPIF
jgi:hypothetical protein